MKRIKVKLARAVTYDNKKQSKQDIQYLGATLILDNHVELGDFMGGSSGSVTESGVCYKTKVTPWYIDNVTPLDMEGKKREKKRNTRTIKEINDAETRVGEVDTEGKTSDEDNGADQQAPVEVKASSRNHT